MVTEPRNLEPDTCIPLSESLAWLDFCLGETQAAIEAVQEAALVEIRTGEAAGCSLAGDFHEICESGARLITLRGQARRWGQV